MLCLVVLLCVARCSVRAWGCRIQQSWGLKLEQLKGELEQLLDVAAED